MIDLTTKFETAIKIKNESFIESKWYSSLVLLLTQSNFIFIWDDIDDRWIKIGSNKEIRIMAARSLPFIFIQNSCLIENFSKIYANKFVFEVFTSYISSDFSVDKGKLRKWLPWYGDDLWCENFSLEDLFYETH